MRKTALTAFFLLVVSFNQIPLSAQGGSPSLVFSPSSLSFPTTPVGSISVEQLVKITNNGSAPAIFSDVFVPSNYAIDWNPPTSLKACSQTLDGAPNLLAGASCAIGITFRPTTAPVVIEPRTGTAPVLGIDLCPPCQNFFYKLPLSGTAGNGPVLSFSPNRLAFPPTAAGSVSAPINVTVKNTGTATATISGLPTSPIFKLASNPAGTSACVPSIAAGATCTLSFTFNPPATAAVGAVLTADALADTPNGLNILLAPLAGDKSGALYSLSASGTVTAQVIAPAVTLSSNTLNFSATAGESMSQQLTITNSGSAPLSITSYTLTGSNAFAAGQDCIGSPIAATKSCVLTVTFQPVSAGAMQASLVINDNATPPQQTVTLLGVATGVTGPPLLSVAPSVLNFMGLAAGPAQSQPLLVANAGGGGPLDFTTSITTDSPWLSVSPAAGKTDTLGSASVDFPSLSPSVLRGNISVASAAGDPVSVDANVLALPAGPVLGVSQRGLVFNFTAGVGTTDTDQVAVLNQGNSDMTWTAELLAGSQFLAITPSSGTAPAGGSAGLTIAPKTAVVPNASDLAAGDYYGLVRVTAPGAANSPQYVTTVAHVAGDSLYPTVKPAGLALVSVGTATTKNLRIAGSSAAKYNFTITTTSTGAANWLSVSPASGSVSAAAPVDIIVTANPAAAGPKAGIYTGEINIALTPASSGGTKNLTVAVLLVALPAGAKPAAERAATTTGCTPASLGMTQTLQPGGFSVSAGWPAALAFNVIDDCANPVNNAQVVVTFSNGDPALAAGLTDPSVGEYSATWAPQKPATAISFTAKAAAGTLTPAQVRYSGSVAPSPAPLVYHNGTVHQMYPQPGAPLAPGTLIQINGANLATSAATPTDVPLPTMVNGTSVLIGSYSAPLASLSNGTLGAQMPVELAPNNQYPVVAIVNGAISTPDLVTVAASTPGIQATTDGYAAAQHADQSAVTAGAPAAPGEVVSIFLSGLGATDPAVASGAQGPAVEPLARITTPATVTLNGNTMAVAYAGLAPGQVGLYRIDFTVPVDSPAGDLPLSVSQNGLKSNTVLLTVGAGQ